MTHYLPDFLVTKLDHLAENHISADTMARTLGDMRREARLEVIAELLEVRDRFSRGVEEAQRRLAGLRGFWARFAQREVLTALDDEIARLREVYRLPVILCGLEGLSQEEVAQRLGIARTTLYLYLNGDGSPKALGQALLSRGASV